MRKFAQKSYAIGVLISALLLAILSLADTHDMRAPGPFNTGHESLSCDECHDSAKGSMRQQVQANLAYVFSQRTSMTAFNFQVPDNKDCLACHAREDDKHPVYRFNEPRFSQVRQAIQPQYCYSCHQEHTGVRVSSEIEVCRHCHEEIEVKHDPLDISHADLIKLKDWDTCLGCHDFHGNHIMKTPTKIKHMLNKAKVEHYFSGGEDPYSQQKIAQSRKSRHEN